MHQPDLHTARTAYDAIAAADADRFTDTLDSRPIERGLLAAFAELVRRGPAGPVADLGCGPGHIAAHLHGFGLSVLGVDQSAEMLAVGRARYPEVRFVLGSMPRLGLADGSCRALLSRASIIHLPPALMPAAWPISAGCWLPAAGCCSASRPPTAPNRRTSTSTIG
jgi:SAM-dependent methyltransferase